MDIGKQQRVIIVEVDESMTGQPAPVDETARIAGLPDAGDAWPLPLDLDPDFDLVPADQSG